MGKGKLQDNSVVSRVLGVVKWGKMVYNLNHFRSLLPQQTMIAVMVKAFSYGSGSNGYDDWFGRTDWLCEKIYAKL